MIEPNKYYRKPGQSFRCGLSSLGRPCSHGPQGSACGNTNNNDEKCYPVRTLTGLARVASLFGTLLAIAFLLVVLPSASLKTTIAPGPLSNPHAQLLLSKSEGHDPHSSMSISSENRCMACHPSTSASDAQTTKLPGHFASAKVGAQSQLCMKCHQQSMPNGLEGSPHDLVGDQLVALNSKFKGPMSRSVATRATECSQCHREHRGSGEDLQAITSERCQSCHSLQFKSFSHGHPEFQNYPEAKLRSIAFDHGRHKDLHFQKKNASFDCRTCHKNSSETGAVGSVFRSVSYEQSCANCHDEPLRSAISDGLIVLQVPSLDRAKLMLSGFELGEWPESASQLMDGTLSPLLVELLRGRPDGAEILSSLPPSGKLREMDLSDREQAKLVVRLAENVRAVFRSLARDGQPLVRASFEARLPALRVKADATEQRLVSQNLSGHDASSLAASSVATSPMASITFQAPRSTMVSNWLNQLSSGIPPDLVRTASQRWFTVNEQPTKPMAQPLAQSIHQPQTQSIIRQPKSIVVSTTNQIQSDDLLLVPSGSKPSTPTDDSDLLGTDLLGNNSLLSPSKANDLVQKQSNASGEKPMKPWEHLPYGGWMLDESRVALVYVPQGHADPWLARWIEWQQLSSDNQKSAVQENGLAQQCAQCHAFGGDRVRSMLQQSSVGSMSRYVSFGNSQPLTKAEQMNGCWKIEQRPSAERTITKFNHTPHLTIPSLADCQSCHVLHASTLSATGTHGWSQSGMVLHHEFQTMLIQNCSKCHTKESAGDNCTQCHNYHVHP